MKQRQYITTFSLIVALTGLSPMVAADAGSSLGGGALAQQSSGQFLGTHPARTGPVASPDRPAAALQPLLVLSDEALDRVSAGNFALGVLGGLTATAIWELGEAAVDWCNENGCDPVDYTTHPELGYIF